MTISEVIREETKEILSRPFIGGACAGISAESFRIMQVGYIPMDSYYMFLVMTGLYMIVMWWYPIWMREKEQDKKNRDLIGSVA